jgi:hypothetical protein
VKAATREDLPGIMAALFRMRAKNPNNQMKWAQPEVAERYLIWAIEQGFVVIVDGYMVLYSVVKPWFSDAEFLVEDLILKIGPTTIPVESVIDVLEDLKQINNCVCTIVGDTQVGYMGPKYLARGFRLLGSQLIKE